MNRTPPPPHDDGDQLTRVVNVLRRRGRSIVRAEPMAGDVSRRRYARLEIGETDPANSPGSTAVLALYPPDLREACERSLVSGRLLHEAGVRVAAVLEAACDPNPLEEPPAGGWVLLEDLGEETLYDRAARPWAEVESYFEAAVDLLPRIAGLPRQAVERLNPPLDRDLLLRELTMTREAFLVPAGLDVEPRLWAALEELCGALGAEPPVPCHRDFGARNLIPLPDVDTAHEKATVGVLDHQDLRLGPPRYDLASLLNDSLFPTADGEARLLVRAGLPAEGEVEVFGLFGGRASYHRAAAQRTLKAVGSYAAFARRGGGRHVALIAPTLARALEHLRRAPETAAVAAELAERWRDAAQGSS